MSRPSRVIAVVGGAAETDPTVLAMAQEVGRLLADQDCIVLCGGRGGVMEAAAAGARGAGGHVVGLLPGTSPDDANRYVDIVLPTGLGEARNAVIATAASGMIAVGGEHGTLSEIALALKLGKPVVTIASPWSHVSGTIEAKAADDAVARLLQA